MSDTLPPPSPEVHPHRRRLNHLNSSSTLSAIRHVHFRRPTVDHGKRDRESSGRKKKSKDDARDEAQRSEMALEGNAGFLKKITWRQRIKHFTWTWFTMTMATGGIANVIDMIPAPFRFPQLYALGATFFILNLFLFLFNITMISARFYLYPATFKASFLHPTESLFIPAVVISFGTILINITQYGIGRTGPWLESTMIILFWIYCSLAILFSIGIYLLMWSTQTFTIARMTPIWIFPAYPLLITGPFASNLASLVSPRIALRIILGGSILQSIGFLVSLSIYSAFLYRLMTQKLPPEALRPGMFISVGPSGFTSAGVIGMARTLPRAAGADFMGAGMGDLATKISVVMANWWGLWLWGLAIWWFLVSCGAHFGPARKGRLHFAMTWFSFIFPNTALTTSTFSVSIALNGNLASEKTIPHSARPFQCLGIAMTFGLVVMWFYVVGMMIRAVILRQILWPQMQEDRDEGGWGKDSKDRKGEKMTMENNTPRAMVSMVQSPMLSAWQVNQVVGMNQENGDGQGLANSSEDSVKE